MPIDVQQMRAEIYELARLLKSLGDVEGSRRVIHALLVTEEAAALIAIDRFEQFKEE